MLYTVHCQFLKVHVRNKMDYIDQYSTSMCLIPFIPHCKSDSETERQRDRERVQRRARNGEKVIFRCLFYSFVEFPCFNVYVFIPSSLSVRTRPARRSKRNEMRGKCDELNSKDKLFA